MPRNETIISVFVASPNEVATERQRLEEIISELNNIWSKKFGLRFDLIRWETHSYPGFGTDAQDVINQQIPVDYDVFIGIMWQRFGTRTGRAESGTEEEFLRAKEKFDHDPSSINLMMYFKEELVNPGKIDIEQLTKVDKFRRSLGEKGGLYWTFNSADDFVNIVRPHLSRVLNEWAIKSNNRDSNANIADTVSRSTAATQLNAVESDDSEEGLIELIERFEDDMSASVEVMTRIAKATEVMGKKFDEHTKRANAANTSGNTSRSTIKRILAKTAQDMQLYADKIGIESPILRSSFESSINCASKVIAMWPEFKSDENKDQMIHSAIALKDFHNTLTTVEHQIQGFINTVAAFPRLSSELNRAKKAVMRSLQPVVDMFSNQQDLVYQTYKSAEAAISLGHFGSSSTEKPDAKGSEIDKKLLETSLLSEVALGDWNRPEEDEAWSSLQPDK